MTAAEIQSGLEILIACATIIGTIMALAFNAGTRFTRIEMSIAEVVRRLDAMENVKAGQRETEQQRRSARRLANHF